MTTGETPPPTQGLTGARLPRWCLPQGWPEAAGEPALSTVEWAGGRVHSLRPSAQAEPGLCSLGGAPLLPGLVDAHTHIDKCFTLHRLGPVKPGLLAAIDAMMLDRQRWTAEDVKARAEQALHWAFAAGVTRLRTHVDWWEPQSTPLAWSVLRDLADKWGPRLLIDRVSLMPLSLFAERASAMSLAREVASSGRGACLGGFVHTSNWSASALRHLLEAAQAFGLDVDLHVDEELNPAAIGLRETARLLREIDFSGRAVCGHACALAVQDDHAALATLDAVARTPITLVTLPTTNLLLQDARPGRTPRLRGVTLVKEARERGIPLLIASDNVQDAFCSVGSFDPVEALAAAVLAAQLESAFDVWSQCLCRPDWLNRGPTKPFELLGQPAHFVAFSSTGVQGWPSRSQSRVVWREGVVVEGQMPCGWSSAASRPDDLRQQA